jgi:putative phage-type endonuclease
MLVENVLQQSADWHEMRKGMITGSMVGDAIAKMATQPHLTKKCEQGKHGTCEAGYCNCSCHGARPGTLYQKCREDYMWDLVATRLTGQMPDRYVSRAMEFGTEHEPEAIAAYESKMGCMVEPVGFAFHPTIQWFGASPDGLVGDDGCIEVKCPNSATHLSYILDGCVPDDYLPQMKAVMACAERKWCDFVSFDPRMPKSLRLFVRRLERDQPMIDELEAEVVKFLAEVEQMLEAVTRKIPALVMIGMETK